MGLVTSALCCACTGLSCACSLMGCCCSVATAAAGGISTTAAKYFNVLLLGFVTAICLVLKYYADDWDLEFGGFGLTVCSSVGNESNLDVTGTYEYYAYCKGDTAVFRVSASLEVFFAVMIILSFLTTAFHRGFWFWKVLVVLGLGVASLFIPADSFNDESYIWTARIFSIVFILVQLFLILNFAYDWNDKWVDNSEKSEGGERCWLSAILACAFILYALSLTGIGLLYKNYAGCSVGTGVTTVTLLSMLIFTAIALFRDRLVGEEGAILPAAVVSAYITYLAWSALESNPDESCKPVDLSGTNENSGGSVAVGIIIAVLSMMWVANQSASSATSFLSGGKGKAASGSESARPTLIYEVGEGRTAEDMRRQQDDRYGREDSKEDDFRFIGDRMDVALFYFVMITSTMYMSMVLTNWGAVETGAKGTGQMWARIVSQWLTIVLYTWTLIAPGILTNRDFSTAAAGSSSRGNSATMQRSVAQV